MTSCHKCVDYRKKIKEAPTISGPGKHPSTLELAYLVNFQYFVTMSSDCWHKVVSESSKIDEMVQFLEKKNWKISTKTQHEGFYCTAFLNHPAKQLVIVHRGTELTNLWQLEADLRLALNRVTPEIIKRADWHTLQSLLNNALKLNDKVGTFVRNDYSVTITGHSLGGWLAQLCSLLAKYPKFFPAGPRGTISFGNSTSLDMNQSYDLHCVTFDSPGANAILERLRDDPAWLNGEPRDVEVALHDLDITVYLANKNFVNSCGAHFGTVKNIDVMSNASYLKRLFGYFSSHGMEGILEYFRNNPE